ncbi:MAG: hypothetical protein KDD51_13540 [Bdellovibrionales bacterium]|nr:hypothetical protein [Bdellovibrionales bacterium]
MDDLFPKYLRRIVQRLDFLGIPNLGMLVAGLAVLAFLARMGMNAPLERFTFDPYLVSQGEWWRLFAFPTGLTNPLFLFFYVLYVYYVMGSLESHWGPGPLTIFVGFSYLMAIAGAFAVGQPVSIWYHVLENVSLAFGTLFPDVTFYLFFVVPVRAKWLALFAGALLLFQFVVGGFYTKIFLLIVLLPYLIFFGPYLFSWIKNRRSLSKHKRRFDQDMWR